MGWFNFNYCTLFNKKGALSSSEDESAPCVGNIPVAKKADSSLRQPGYPFIQDPWLCVTRLLWLCPFGERRNLDQIVERLALLVFNPAHSIKKEHCHLPKMRVLLVSVMCRGQDAYLISSATRPSFLFRTRGFASPDYSGFARSENVMKLRSNC